MKRFIDILPKISNWEAIKYAPELNCPHCGKSGFWQELGGEAPEKPNLIGWCECTGQGFMMVFECTKCFEKYRFHGNTCDLFDIDNFDYHVGAHYVDWVANRDELEAKWDAYWNEGKEEQK